MQRWYSQQALEGNAPGHPLGLNDYQEFGPIKMVGGGGGGDKSNEADTVVRMAMARPASADSVFSALIADSNQLGYCVINAQ